MKPDDHYLKREFYSLLKKDSSIFNFFEESTLDGLWYWDLENPDNVWMNPRFWALFGYDPHERKHLNSEWQDLIFPEDLQVAINNFNKHCADPKHPYDQIVRYRHKDGSTIWVRCRGIVIRDETGKPIRMLGAHTDLTKQKQAEDDLLQAQNNLEKLVEERTAELTKEITEHKKTEDALRISEERFQMVVNAIEDVVFVLNREQRYTDLWGKWLEKNGLNVEQFLDKTSWEIFGEDTRQFFGEINKQVLNGETVVYERWFDLPFGNIFYHTTLSPLRDTNGNVIGIVGLGRDLTAYKLAERKLAEEKTRKSEEYIRDILNTVDEGFIVIDRDYRIMTANRAYCEQVSLPHEKVVGNHCYTISHQAERPCFEKGEECVAKEVFATGKFHTYTHKHFNKDGETVFVETTAFPNRDESGNVVSVIETIRNVTERKQAEEEKTKLQSQLHQAQKMEAIGTMAGGIAHDFNNILTIIISGIESAMDDISSESPAENDIKTVLQAAERAKELVKQILIFSRKEKQEYISVKPHLIVKEYLKFVRSTIPTTVEIRQNIDSECGFINADPTQIHQVIMNLCVNAAHAMDEKGDLEISLKEVALNAEDIAHQPGLTPGSYARLSVTDNGVGMDQETIDRIFDPFFTTKGVGKGTGMGLSVVHGIVNAHSGMITVKSAPGEGTSFHVFFPIMQSGTDIQNHGESEPLPTGTERILFVDDEKSIARFGGRLLKDQGYQVTVKTDSLDAFETFKSNPAEFDLVITDQTMPKMSGAELAQKLLIIRPDIPIILCTGYSNIISEENAQELGIKEFCTKPLNSKQFTRTVRRVLDENKV